MKIPFLLMTSLFAATAAAAQPAPATSVNVVSLNLAKVADPQVIVSEIGKWPILRDADVFLFQEVAHPAGEGPSVAEKAALLMNMHVVYTAAKPGVWDQGLAIVSRYPIAEQSIRALKPYDLRFRSRSRIALSATIATPNGPVRIANAHLDTRLNARERMEQLRPVVGDCADFTGPQIVGGDFNSNNFYWLGRVLPIPFPRFQTRAVHSFMTGQGFVTPVPLNRSTFDFLGLKLDWIFANGLHSRDAQIIPLRFSDHHAVWAQFSYPAGGVQSASLQ